MSKQECANLITRSGDPVILLGVKTTGDLRGLIFEATVEQRFCNSTQSNVEVVYTFPLPWGAVLLGVDVQLGEKYLSGAVVGKKFAEAEYEEALSAGNAAIMLEKNNDQSYSLNLGNLVANESCVITFRYAQTLKFEQQGLRVLIPTVIAPRFGDAVADGGLQPHQSPVHSLLVEYPFNIELRLHGDMARARVASPSHPIRIAHANIEDSSMVTISLGRNASLDRDFILVIDQLTHDSVSVLARDMVDADAIVALTSLYPRIPNQSSLATTVKILVDCSGSMAGNSIEAARRALQSIVRGFMKGDQFSLSRFGSSVEHRSRGLWSSTITSRLAAQRWVGNLRADMGGTEMESALTSTFALAHSVASDVLLVTDGEISSIDQTIRAAQSSKHRIFVVGIGSSPAEVHLRRLAEATGGACDFVAPGEAVEPAILRMFVRLRSPRLNDVTVAWPEGFSPDWYTAIPKSVFNGDTINLFAHAKEIPSGYVRLMGRVDGGDMLEIASAELSPEVQEGTTISRMAVADRLQLKTEVLVSGLNSTIRDMAVAYQLVTDQTNFLLVHERAEEKKPLDIPELHKVSQMLAAGWSGTGDSVFRQTQSQYRAARTSDIKFCAIDTTGSFDNQMSSREHSSTPMVFRTSRRRPLEEEKKVEMDPLSLCIWLRSMPEINWPSNYCELRKIGVNRWVVEWLEIVVAAKHATAITEAIIVRAFLHAMSQHETFEMLSMCSNAPTPQKGFFKRLSRFFSGIHAMSNIGVDLELSAEILKDLECMTALTWPDQIFDLSVETME